MCLLDQSCYFGISFDEEFFSEEQNIDDGVNISSLCLDQDEVIKQCNFPNERFVPPHALLDQSIIDKSIDDESNRVNGSSNPSVGQNYENKSFRTVLELIQGSIVGMSSYSDFIQFHSSDDGDINEATKSNPTIAGIARHLSKQDGKLLDEKQYITYEMICCTFLLQFLDDALDPSSSVYKQIGLALQHTDHSDLIDEIKMQLLARGGMYQLLLFLTGPAGAGKTTAIKAAERFCYEFCSSCNVLWSDTTFFYTAYTGSAASAFGGRTIIKASGMFTTSVSEIQRSEWSRVRILVIDEISFMTENELKKLDIRLRQYKDRNKVFGGYCIIFGGDFRQLIRGHDHELMYSRNSQQFFESILTGIIILDNEHRFKDDPEFGKLLKRFWRGELSQRDRNLINKRLVTRPDVDLPFSFQTDLDWSYACPTNKERNAISAGVFKNHILKTHPPINSASLPPDHTVVIEGDFQTSTKNKSSSLKVTNTLRHRILTTCGDANIEYGSHKHADPILCLYSGIDLICVMSNEKMEEKPPRGNGTVVKLVSVKIKPGATSHVWREFYGRKVWTVNIRDVQYLTVELSDDSEDIKSLKKEIDHLKQNPTNTNASNSEIQKLERLLQIKTHQRQFRIPPEQHEVKITVTPTRFCDLKETFKCHMTLFPVNINTSSTGHKLQGRSKDILIITSWPKYKNNICFRNWEYVVLSRVRTLAGLYLFQPIDMEQSFKPTDELVQFLKRAERSETALLQKRKLSMEAL